MSFKLSRRKLIGSAFFLGSSALLGQIGLKSVYSSTWPSKYEKLNPQETAELTYAVWGKYLCGASIIYSIFEQLGQKIGEPYKSFPVDAFILLKGGMVGWGTLCGSLNSAAIVASLIIGQPQKDKPDYASLIASNLMYWYSNTNLPTFEPKCPKTDIKMPKTTSKSPLCHVSCGRWMKASGYPLASAQRLDRCARVSASVAYKLVEELNKYHEGLYNEPLQWNAQKAVGINAQFDCVDCHTHTIPSAPKLKS
ncbi:Putative redox-active protein (C_GCAxxG_C_C) [Desulfurella multipotens]|uniref:Putative redox-active protein (C_GCAxxG_C_C) n=1 Tax=Desulfurella multipotens TaxID=79269 RepID=A0A1G6J900_9BACT|nr:C-GCAxxG-C-C family protein [Desulfurella multipotens]SDC15073.1 Putative redox-active protein (C_GCAxxG_C_C) [Desulfurella multipotens]